MKHLKNIFNHIGNFIKDSKLKCQRKILKWKVTYSPDEMKRFSALTIISLTALIILVLCVVEETKNVVLHGQSSLIFVDPQNELSPTECNLDYITMKSREDDDPCVINFIRRVYLFNNNLPTAEVTGESSNDVMLTNKSPLLDHHRRIDSNNELSTTYEERKVSQVVTKFMQSRGKKQDQGFFVECCGTASLPAARDQLSTVRRPFSSTIHLEKFWDWSGILIHSNPDNIDLMRNDQKKNNKIIAALPVCVNLQDEPNSINSAVAIPSGNYFINEKKLLADSSYNNKETVNLPSMSSPDRTKVGVMDFSNQENYYSLFAPLLNNDMGQCFSLNSILLASNQSKIDFLSLINLNIANGANDLIFLQNIPWYKIDIKMMAMKMSGYPDVVKRAVIEFMESVSFFKYATRNLKGVGEVVFLVKKRPFEKITLAEKYREF